MKIAEIIATLLDDAAARSCAQDASDIREIGYAIADAANQRASAIRLRLSGAVNEALVAERSSEQAIARLRALEPKVR